MICPDCGEEGTLEFRIGFDCQFKCESCGSVFTITELYESGEMEDPEI